MSWLAVITRLLPFASQLDDIVEAVEDITHAEGIDNYWSGVKRLGDLLVPILSSVIASEYPDEASVMAIAEAQRIGDGKLIEKLKNFYESPIGQLIFQLLLKKISG